MATILILTLVIYLTYQFKGNFLMKRSIQIVILLFVALFQDFYAIADELKVISPLKKYRNETGIAIVICSSKSKLSQSIEYGL
jgi:cell shape-determining protein MreD